MAGVGATASLSLMVGVAAATTFAVSAILAGPMLLDCGKSPAGFGTCVHAELVRIVPLRSAMPSPATAAASRVEGRIDAGANTIVAATPPAVALAAPEGTIDGRIVEPSVDAMAVAVAPLSGAVSAGVTDAQTAGSIAVGLSPAPGALSASGTGAVSAVDASVALASAPGSLEASGPAARPASVAAVEIAGGAGEVSATLVAPSTPSSPATLVSAAPAMVAASAASSSMPLPAAAQLSPAAGQIDAGPPAATIAPTPVTPLVASAGAIVASAVSLSVDVPSGEITAEPLAPASASASNPNPASGSVEASVSASGPSQLEASVALNGTPHVSPLEPVLAADPPSADLPPDPPPLVQASPVFPNVLTLPLPSASDGSVVTLQLN